MKSFTILEDVYKAFGINPNDNTLAFILQGIFMGIALNDVWRILHLPGENVPIVIGNQALEYEVDFVYQLAIATAFVILQVFGLKHGAGFGAGVALGSTFANQSETGKTISMIPFANPDAKQ